MPQVVLTQRKEIGKVGWGWDKWQKRYVTMGFKNKSNIDVGPWELHVWICLLRPAGQIPCPRGILFLLSVPGPLLLMGVFKRDLPSPKFKLFDHLPLFHVLTLPWWFLEGKSTRYPLRLHNCHFDTRHRGFKEQEKFYCLDFSSVRSTSYPQDKRRHSSYVPNCMAKQASVLFSKVPSWPFFRRNTSFQDMMPGRLISRQTVRCSGYGCLPNPVWEV